MRRPAKKRAPISADPKYASVKVEKLVNYIMESGNKTAARKAVYGAFEIVKKEVKVDNPLETFETALQNISPLVEVRSRRVGGANYQVPVEVRPERRQALAFRWLIEAARSKKGQPIAKKLATEIIASAKNEGEAVKKRENVHKMAEANKAFAHFAW